MEMSDSGRNISGKYERTSCSMPQTIAKYKGDYQLTLILCYHCRYNLFS